MEKEIYIIKEKLATMIDNQKSKINFTKKFGRRNETVFVVGETQYMESIKIYEDDKYVVFGENVEKAKDEIKKEIIKYLSHSKI